MASYEARSGNRKLRSPSGYLDRSTAMAKPAFYKPPPRWQFFAAFVGAIALEVAAVAVASLHEQDEIPIETGAFQEQPPAEVILTDLPPEPTPPPEETPPPLPPSPTEPTEFVIKEPTPPPRPQNASIPKPRATAAALRAAGAVSGPVNFVSTQAYMISAPHPSYPYEARRAKQTGSGKFLLKFDSNGSVTDVSVVQSTGSEILDQLSMSTFGRWRCRPGIYNWVYVPITFTLEGAQL